MEVKSRVHETYIEIKDLDEVATKQEIRDALIRELGSEVKSDAVKTLRTAYGGTQTALVPPG